MRSSATPSANGATSRTTCRAAYVGVLGGRRRGAALRELLAGEFTPEELARVRLPAGLDLGARDVPEIALSILAEAVAAARGRRGGPIG